MKSTAKGITLMMWFMTSFLIVCVRAEAGKAHLCLWDMEKTKSLSPAAYVAT